MGLTRRQTLTGGALALLGTGFLGRVDKVAAMQKPLSLTDVLKQQATGASEGLLLGPAPGEEGPPEPATYDRLPLEWNKKTVKRFKDKLAERDIQAFLVRKPLNLIYGRMYFDFHHAEGGFPHEGKVQQGKKVDLFTFMLEGLKEHGIQGTKIGIDGELYPSEIKKAKAILPGVEFVDVAQVLMDMRQVKTPEELALWRRAYIYFDRAHAFARDYILTHGTDITDYEVSVATELWINDQLYSDLDLAGGALHHGVRSGVGIGCRAGRVTGFTPISRITTGSVEGWRCKSRAARGSAVTGTRTTAPSSLPTRRARLIPTCRSCGR